MTWDGRSALSMPELAMPRRVRACLSSISAHWLLETAVVLAADVDGLVCVLRGLALEGLDASGTIPMPAELKMLDILVMLAGVVCGRP